MTNITIPPEALEAGADTAFAWLRSHMEDDVRVQHMTDEELTELVSATCLAMLNAWPDSILMPAELILPLPQENALVANGIAVIRSETLEEAARVAEGFPARTHGNLSADPFEAAEQAANECAAAIRALISPAAEEQSPKGE